MYKNGTMATNLYCFENDRNQIVTKGYFMCLPISLLLTNLSPWQQQQNQL